MYTVILTLPLTLILNSNLPLTPKPNHNVKPNHNPNCYTHTQVNKLVIRTHRTTKICCGQPFFVKQLPNGQSGKSIKQIKWKIGRKGGNVLFNNAHNMKNKTSQHLDSDRQFASLGTINMTDRQYKHPPHPKWLTGNINILPTLTLHPLRVHHTWFWQEPFGKAIWQTLCPQTSWFLPILTTNYFLFSLKTLTHPKLVFSKCKCFRHHLASYSLNNFMNVVINFTS